MGSLRGLPAQSWRCTSRRCLWSRPAGPTSRARRRADEPDRQRDRGRARMERARPLAIRTRPIAARGPHVALALLVGSLASLLLTAVWWGALPGLLKDGTTR